MGDLRAAPVVGPSGRGSAPPSRPNDLNSTTKITHSIFFYPSVSTFTSAATANINLVRRGINTAHRRITGLATLGEGVVNWNKADYLYYRNRRLQADSILNSLKRHCREYVRPEQIDTLRALLAEKETHLLHIMEMFERQTEADSVLVNQLPEVARRATHIRTIEQKKKCK